MQTIVMYHAHCFDGTMAAAAALKALEEGILVGDLEKGLYSINYPQATLDTFFGSKSPYEYSQSSAIPAEHFLFLDFCPKAEVITGLLSLGKQVTVLDHHKTAEADIASLDEGYGLELNFDMTKSGARLAWEYFFGEVPQLVLHVEDRDLWKWKLAGTREVMAWLSATAKTNDPDSYLKAIGDFEEDERSIRKIGAFLTAEMDSQIVKIASAHRFALIPGYGEGIVVNATCYPSEVCAYLYDHNDVPWVIAYQVNRNKTFSLSFRSKNGSANAIDVTTLAKEFGGGGHKHASGGVADLETWFDILDNSLPQKDK